MFVIDRIEGDFLIIEGEARDKDEPVFFQMPRVLLPDAKEGDCLDIAVNRDETQKREKKINRLMDDLFTD